MIDSQKKNIWFIFLYLAFYGLSIGVWSDFAQLWLTEQGITIANIGIIIACATVAAGIIVILLTKFIKKANELLVLKCIFALKLVFLALMLTASHLSLQWLCIVSFIFDSITNNLIAAVTYPIISYIVKNDQIYGKRKLVEYSAIDLGLLLAGFLIGRQIGSLFVDYNVMIVLSMFFALCAAVFAFCIKNEQKFYSERKVEIKKIFKDKILRVYLFYLFISKTAFFTALGMQLLMVVRYAQFSSSTAALFIVVCCICGDIFGFLALKKLTPKNDYLTVLLKFGTRFLFYLAIVIFPTRAVFLVGIFVSFLISRAYENRTDGIYINRCDKADLFAFSNVRYTCGYMGKALGTLIVGFTFELGVRYIFGICLIFMAMQIAVSLYLVKMRKDEEKQKPCDETEQK